MFYWPDVQFVVDIAGNTGSAGEVLGSNGAGGLNWVTPSGGAPSVGVAEQFNVSNGAGAWSAILSGLSMLDRIMCSD